jgi:voltage-gated potassium channel
MTRHPQTPGPRESSAYQLFILVLSVLAVVAIAVETTVPVDPDTRTILEYADLLVCGLFFADFIRCLVRAENRWRYFVTWGWLDLAASIPVFDIGRFGRLARVMRILRVLRGIRAARIIGDAILRQRRQSAFFAAALLVLLMIVTASVSILQFEVAETSNIRTAEEAIWWTITTITTVGYGDKYPVTTAGRVVAAFLMFAGVGLFGTFSGFLASWFVTPQQEDSSTTELATLRGEIERLRFAIDAGGRGARSSPPPDPGGT